jgi:hypothetical protein
MRLAVICAKLKALSVPCYLRLDGLKNSAFETLHKLGYHRSVGDAVYSIDAFPGDDSLWRIEWIGGFGYNSSAPSDTLDRLSAPEPGNCRKTYVPALTSRLRRRIKGLC